MNVDVCPRCRIQAPHQDGRTVCPRCGGPLSVLDARTRQPVDPAVRRPSSLRWVAHRPASTLPTPPARKPEPSPEIPSYGAVPGWGLIDQPVVPEVETPARDIDLHLWLRRLGPIVVAGAFAHLLRYAVLALNRSRPIPTWLDLFTTIAVLVLGIATVAAAVVTLYYFARWVIGGRAASYQLIDRRDPRSPRMIALLSATPFVNVAGAPFLLAEAATAAGGDAGARALRRIQKIAIGWGLVNLVGLIALVYRFIAWRSDALQTDADALGWVTLSFVLSAVFVYWAGPRLAGTLVTEPAPVAQPARRLVVHG